MKNNNLYRVFVPSLTSITEMEDIVYMTPEESTTKPYTFTTRNVGIASYLYKNGFKFMYPDFNEAVILYHFPYSKDQYTELQTLAYAYAESPEYQHDLLVVKIKSLKSTGRKFIVR